MESKLDIIIPVYNEGENIVDALNALRHEVKTPTRVLIVYDFEEDNTLPVLRRVGDMGFEITILKNRARGAHEAIMTGFDAVRASAVLVYPADEAYNAKIIDAMYARFKEDADVVVASRFMKGGQMTGRALLQAVLVRAGSFMSKWLAGLPTSDATYGMRLVSKRLLDTVEIESTAGWTYAIELLVKCDRLGWNIAEVPAEWHRRVKGTSKFNLKKWLPLYARWFFYALATTYLRKGPETVKRKS